MRVNGYTGGFIKGAEIATLNSAPYGSVRVQYKSSGVPGVCEGNFFYSAFPFGRLSIPLEMSLLMELFSAANDNLEVDFEILTSTTRTSSPYVPAGIWATNQVSHHVPPCMQLEQVTLTLFDLHRPSFPEVRRPTRSCRSRSTPRMLFMSTVLTCVHPSRTLRKP